MSCKSSLCLRCAKVYVDNWVSQVSKVLHEGVIYRHIILTVPAMFRTIFYQNATVLLSALMRCGVQCLDDFYSEVKGKALKGGYITVIHTHGRNGQYHPHVHLIATSGGYDGVEESWEHVRFLPYDLLGFDHGVGHPLLLLYDAKAPLGENSNYFNGLGHDLFNTSIRSFYIVSKYTIFVTL